METRRTEQGMIKMRVQIKYPAYNSRRYGKPWGALVKFEGAKPVYDFSAGAYLGDDRGGVVYIKCEPGDIVASGQRDHRGGHTSNDLYIVQQDGNLLEVDKVQAFEHWEGRQKEQELPLAKYSTDELIMELRRRGVEINNPA